MHELLRINVNRAYRPLRARASVFGAPARNTDQYRNFLDMVIELFDGFTPDKLEAFERRRRPSPR
jgi:hypothetical protein